MFLRSPCVLGVDRRNPHVLSANRNPESLLRGNQTHSGTKGYCPPKGPPLRWLPRQQWSTKGSSLFLPRSLGNAGKVDNSRHFNSLVSQTILAVEWIVRWFGRGTSAGDSLSLSQLTSQFEHLVAFSAPFDPLGMPHVSSLSGFPFTSPHPQIFRRPVLKWLESPFFVVTCTPWVQKQSPSG